MESKKCVICGESSKLVSSSGYIHFVCIRCGDYSITQEVTEDYQRELSDQSVVTKISGWINENPGVNINSDKFLWLIKNLMFPNVYEKAQKLLKWINQKTEHPGFTVVIRLNVNDENCIKLHAVCWAFNENEIRYLIEYLVDKNFLARGKDDNINIPLVIEPAGFAYLEDLHKNPDSNLGFCAMWFDEGLDAAWEGAIEPAIKQAGYYPQRIDKHPHNGVIVDEIISLIRRSKFVITDLTGNRGGVYFEAGFAKGLGIEVIFTCRNDYLNQLHFDVRHFNFLVWDAKKYEEFKNNLAYRIESTLGRGKE